MYTGYKLLDSEEKVMNKLLDFIGDVPYDDEDVKIAGKLFYTKYLAVHNYKPSRKFHGSVTLFRGTKGFMDIDEDYGLSKVRME